ncbi:GlyGly-CTERM sorting domain-containing protein [Parashewanella curva]|uniref:GlyGly-CTERM sorting domain-containing protein n=1 Tax=Parashewanella curva TaxID=2338552 RepID=A0A3L8PUF5_9GAMM|nr:S8 family serine peptidase [Parashewanella curva]RLV59055.1 GlyGly-CTERM sorting domain-containing protein [Parashewanella curva]
MRTKIALAISAALLSSNAVGNGVEKYQALGLTSNLTPEFAELSPKKEQQASAWMVKLKTPSVSEMSMSMGESYSSFQAVNSIENVQQQVMSALESNISGLNVLSTTKVLVNAIIVAGDEKQLAHLKQLPEVEAILPIYDYDLHVADSAVYIKAKQLIDDAVATGQGQRVAILDTGIDYTHKIFGGAGTKEAYDAAVANRGGSVNWPQGIVQGGWDFINNDPNPIDAGTSHGTHVSHSVTGVAPDVELFVYSVCGGGCPGVAQLRALERAMDPNNDGDISDRVDTVNMSLGGSFGYNRGDAVQEQIDRMVELGVNLVISAGNDGPTPFIVGGPSTSDHALSVGAMTHPTGKVGELTATVDGEKAEALNSGFNPSNNFSFSQDNAPLVYPASNQNGCVAFADNIDFTGKAVIIDRGACAFVDKVKHAQDKGAKFVIIANNRSGDIAPGGSATNITIPSVGITQAIGNKLKQLIADDDVTYSFVSKEFDSVGAIADFTSRGPSIAGTLKPEITAPGVAIQTAHPGTGNGLSPASGTSFSGPITAGAVSLLREALPERNALEIKATLMNAANLDVTMEPKAQKPSTALAPISYIGAGLVDVEKASKLPVVAWDESTKQAALAFGLVKASSEVTLTKTITVKNFSDEDLTYDLKVTPRYQDDIDSGALTITVPDNVKVPAKASISFDVTAKIEPAKLPEWELTSTMINFPAPGTDNPAKVASDLLTKVEFDGSIDFLQGDEKALHVVYHMLPKSQDEIDVERVLVDNQEQFIIENKADTELVAPTAISLTATDPVENERRFDLISASTEFLPQPACDSNFIITNTIQLRDPFLVNKPFGIKVDFDVDNDGSWDYSAQALRNEMFGRGRPGGLVTFSTRYGIPNGAITRGLHYAGTNFLTLVSCSEEVGIDASKANQSIKVRYRVEDSIFDWRISPNADFVTEEITVAPTRTVSIFRKTEKADSERLEAIEKGEKGYLTVQKDPNAKGAILLTRNGNLDVKIDESEEANSAPTLENTEVTVDKGTVPGTVLGTVKASDPDKLSSPITEFITLSSSSTNVIVSKSGQIMVAPSGYINQQTETITITVKAVDSNGNISMPATVTVKVNNTTPTVTLGNAVVRDVEEVRLIAVASDDDNDKLTYEWTQISGKAVNYSTNGAILTFNSPAGSHELAFKVVTSDTRIESEATATVKVNGNNLPVISVHDIEVRDLDSVTLTATGSDTDGDSLKYVWKQTKGQAVTFSQKDNTIDFTSPAGNHDLEFQVTANDGRGTVTVSNKVKVNGNSLPVVTLKDVEVRDLEKVELIATSTDTDSDTHTYVWKQTAGKKVDFVAKDNKITFTSPAGDNELKFSVTVADGRGAVTQENTVKIKGNTVPTLTAENSSIVEGNKVTLKANIQDVENDTVTYKWTQTKGEKVEFVAKDDTITFSAPVGSYEFTVVANDGRGDSKPVTVTATVNAKPAPAPTPAPTPEPAKKSSGSLGWLALLLLPVAALRRRQK